MSRRTIGRRAIVVALALGAVVLVAVSNPRSNDPRCTGARVAVMTLSDSGDVQFHPVPATIEQLQRVHRPRRVSAVERNRPVEAKTFKINARLVSMKKLADSEVDMVVSAPKGRARPMTVVFEGTRICSHSAVVRGGSPMKNAREALYAACGKPHKRRVALSGTAEISGVGFFGHTRGLGTARNGIELHPVLQFKSADCRRRR